MYMTLIISKTISQRLHFSYPPRISDKSKKISRNKQGKNALFVILKKLNIIDSQINTTKLVVMTLPNYHKKEFKIH